MSKYFIGESYSIAPSSIRFDQESIEYNRKHSVAEYEALKLSIESIGQEDPVIINNKTGLCEDGYTRTQVCKELGIDVKCIQIDGTLDVSIRRELYMKNIAAREYSTAQKAVMAYRYMMLTKCKLYEASKKHKVDSKALSQAVTIAGLGRKDVLDQILETGMYEGSKNIRVIANTLRVASEEVVVTYPEESRVDYLDLINTAIGKGEFYPMLSGVENGQHELRMLLVNYLNYKYKLTVNQETGEVA